jgi:hypothetical protein
MTMTRPSEWLREVLLTAKLNRQPPPSGMTFDFLNGTERLRPIRCRACGGQVAHVEMRDGIAVATVGQLTDATQSGRPLADTVAISETGVAARAACSQCPREVEVTPDLVARVREGRRIKL